MNRFSILFSLLIFCFVYSQNTTITYELTYKPNENTTKTKICELDIIGSESVFRTLHDKQSDSLWITSKQSLGRDLDFHNQFYIIKKQNKAIKNITHPHLGDIFSINITEKLKWKILPETMKIADYHCQKATISYGGREWIAWFTTDIPLLDGPYIFRGLPGLILLLHDTQNDYHFSMIKIRNNNIKTLHNLKKSTIISWKNYQKMLYDYYKDPFSHIKTQNIPIKIQDEDGNDISLHDLSKSVQKDIRDSNNPIEKDKKVDYK